MARLSVWPFIALAMLCEGCVPLVTHGPRVDAGPTGGAYVSVITRRAFEGEIETGQGYVSPITAPLGFFARYGWTPERNGTRFPFSAGLSMPLAVPFSVFHPEADLYAQATPNRWATAAGAGVLASPEYAMPYVQAGRTLQPGLDAYATQGLALLRGPRAPHATVWMPSLAIGAPGLHLFVQGGLGRERLSADSTRRVRFLMAGFIADTRASRKRSSSHP